jgi:aerobic-type carbon monoxide dehydrogenase small subunit (CoxS/CutS family)
MAILVINDERISTNLPEDTPLLWFLRDHLGLTGTKFGCGMALCGACTVHVDGEPVRSCITPIGSVAGKDVTTIEGLSKTGEHQVQQAWLAEDVPQCGYCQSGMIMAAAALLAKTPKPTDRDIDGAMDGLICRCGTYNRIRRAIHTAAAMTPAPAAPAAPAPRSAAPGKPAASSPRSAPTAAPRKGG